MRASESAPRHPGRILEEEYLRRLPVAATQEEVARRLGMSRPRLNELIRGAARGEHRHGTAAGAGFRDERGGMAGAQAAWDLWEARRSRRRMREVEASVEPLGAGGAGECGGGGRCPRWSGR